MGKINVENLLAAFMALDPDQIRTWPEAISDSVGQWRDVHPRFENNTMTRNDWEWVRLMYHGVVFAGEDPHSEWMQSIASRFGAQSHAIPYGMNARMALETSPPQSTQLDSLAQSALVYAYQLTPNHSPMEEGLSRYLSVDPEMRTFFTDQMVAFEQMMDAVKNMDESDVERMGDKLEDSPVLEFAGDLYVDLKDLLFERESHAFLQYHAIMNRLFDGQPVRVNRVHINMTTINEMDDTTVLGTVYLDSMKSWILENKGKYQVIQNPERTSFQFIDPSERSVKHQIADFKREIKALMKNHPDVRSDTSGRLGRIISNFDPEVIVSSREISLDTLYFYALRDLEDLEAFKPVIEFQTGLDTAELSTIVGTGDMKQVREAFRGLSPNTYAIKMSNDPVLQQTLNALIIKATLEFNKMLAAQTTFFEKEGSKVKYTGPVYPEDKARPTMGDIRELYYEYLQNGTGFVGPGQYDPSIEVPQLQYDDLQRTLFNYSGQHLTAGLLGLGQDQSIELHPRVVEILRIIPPITKLKGEVSREQNNGGLLEKFEEDWKALAHCPPEQRLVYLAKLKTSARRLQLGMREFYSLAITEPRNTWIPKQHEDFELKRGRVLSNIFLEAVTQAGNTNLAGLEIDSFKAYNEAYGKNDVKDVDFNEIRNSVFIVATRMNMPLPVVNPKAGDHLMISFSHQDLDGVEIDPAFFARAVQDYVREKFSDRPFQDYHKVDTIHYQISTEDPEILDRLSDENFLNQLRENFDHMPMQPFIKPNGDAGVVLVIGREADGFGGEMTADKLKAKLKGMGLEVGVKMLREKTERLKLWTGPEGKVGQRDYYLASHTQPAGYRAYMRTLTVSLSVGRHGRVKEPGDIRGYYQAEEIINEDLGAVKRSSWPKKEGLILSEGLRGEQAPVASSRVDVRNEGPSLRPVLQSSGSGRQTDASQGAVDRDDGTAPKAMGAAEAFDGHHALDLKPEYVPDEDEAASGRDSNSVKDMSLVHSFSPENKILLTEARELALSYGWTHEAQLIDDLLRAPTMTKLNRLGLDRFLLASPTNDRFVAWAIENHLQQQTPAYIVAAIVSNIRTDDEAQLKMLSTFSPKSPHFGSHLMGKGATSVESFRPLMR